LGAAPGATGAASSLSTLKTAVPWSFSLCVIFPSSASRRSTLAATLERCFARVLMLRALSLFAISLALSRLPDCSRKSLRIASVGPRCAHSACLWASKATTTGLWPRNPSRKSCPWAVSERISIARLSAARSASREAICFWMLSRCLTNAANALSFSSAIFVFLLWIVGIWRLPRVGTKYTMHPPCCQEAKQENLRLATGSG